MDQFSTFQVVVGSFGGAVENTSREDGKIELATEWVCVLPLQM